MPQDFDIDMGEAQASMDAEFSGGALENQGSGSGEARQTGVSPASDAAPSPAAPSPAQLERWHNAPGSWKKELHQHYGGLPPEVKQYIHQREQEALEGIGRYKQMAEPWQKVVEKYKPAFEHYGFEPTQVFDSLIRSHLALTAAPPEVKREYAMRLIQDYGLGEVLGMQQNPELALRQQLTPLQQRLQRLEQGIESRTRSETEQMVESFLKDPQNEFSGEVIKDMTNLIRTGQAKDLKSAYEQAVWLNPSVRAKLLEREISKNAQPRAQAPANVRSSPAQPTPTARQARSIEEDMGEIYDRLNSR